MEVGDDSFDVLYVDVGEVRSVFSEGVTGFLGLGGGFDGIDIVAIFNEREQAPMAYLVVLVAECE